MPTDARTRRREHARALKAAWRANNQLKNLRRNEIDSTQQDTTQGHATGGMHSANVHGKSFNPRGHSRSE